jgi:hypothetical protein
LKAKPARTPADENEKRKQQKERPHLKSPLLTSCVIASPKCQVTKLMRDYLRVLNRKDFLSCEVCAAKSLHPTWDGRASLDTLCFHRQTIPNAKFPDPCIIAIKTSRTTCEKQEN